MDHAAQQTVHWDEGRWTTPPVSTREVGTDLLVVAAEGSDAWRHTSYGFVHDTEHALLAPLAEGEALEVEFTADFSEQFDQAGLFLRMDEEHWIKAGVEFADGAAQAGAVVTAVRSDWSLSPVPEWLGKAVTLRASYADGAVTIRGGLRGGPLRLLRVAPFPSGAPVTAGPFCCAPSRAGLEVRFHAWRRDSADAELH